MAEMIDVDGVIDLDQPAGIGRVRNATTDRIRCVSRSELGTWRSRIGWEGSGSSCMKGCKFPRSFDEVFRAKEARIILTPIRIAGPER
jgi:hypothetical protein